MFNSSESSPDSLHPSLRAIVGHSPRLQHILHQTTRMARTRLPVLVTGESGTGKELIARALHDLGPVASGPFVAVNCGSLTRELAESELFGHERGAFTGAGTRKIGWFEEATGGTLVLDEVGELPLDLQPKLLRVLETGRLRRVGGQGEIVVDVRIVALTLRDLRQDATQRRFRLDLYHRLAGCELHLPALRERTVDIPLLAQHFLGELAPEFGLRAIEPAAMNSLLAYSWPGNVRELRNALRRAAALSDGQIDEAALVLGHSTGSADLGDARLAYRAADGFDRENAFIPPAHASSATLDSDILALNGKTFEEMQSAIFRWALRRSLGSRRRAAKALGISRSTFCDRVRKLDLAGAGSPHES